MIPLSSMQLLRAWARWGESQGLGYPAMSAFFGERALKSPVFLAGAAPDGVLEVEMAVCALDVEDRDLIIQRWQRHMTFEQIAERHGYSRMTAARKLKAAESEFHRQLDLIFAISLEIVNAKG